MGPVALSTLVLKDLTVEELTRRRDAVRIALFNIMACSVLISKNKSMRTGRNKKERRCLKLLKAEGDPNKAPHLNFATFCGRRKDGEF